MMIRWHVYDLMISHLSQDETMKVVQGIKDLYGENLGETVETVHDYLGMMFDYSFTREVRINMWDHLKRVIKEFPEEMPASDHLFKLHEDGRKLTEELADAFHHMVYQLLFAANRARRDIQLSWKCRRFRCRLQLVLTTWCRVFPTRRPDTADVSETSCDVGFFFSVSYVASLPNCRHVVVW
jgi:hypothetical protein